MFSSQKQNFILEIYSSKNTVFTLPGVALMVGEFNFKSLNQKLNYYVRTGKLLNPRKGIYAKPDYNPEELACLLYTPSYLSLEYVLQKGGIIFQYDSRLTAVSYLSRSIEVEEQLLVYRKMKNEILIDMKGINRTGNINMAIPERAFLDILYLNGSYFFDNVHLLDRSKVLDLLPLYNSAALTQKVNKILRNDKYQPS